MTFEKWTKSGRIYTPKVSIWKRGQIGFNRGAVERFNVYDYSYAILFFDKKERKIGVKFTNDFSEPGICKITKGKSAAVIYARPFLEYYNLLHEKTMRYGISFDPDVDMYVVDIKPN